MPRPMLFNLRFECRTQAVAAFKRPSETNASQWVVGDYHASPWQADSLARPGLPMALDLEGLYEQLIRQHLSVPARQGETLQEQLDRLAELHSKQLDANKLLHRMAKEKQFNRKVMMNAELRNLQQSIDKLVD